MATQRVALVTGASSGFGLETALELSRRGLRVFASMRDLGKVSRLLEAAAAAALRVETLQLDVTDEQSVRRAVALVDERGEGGRGCGDGSEAEAALPRRTGCVRGCVFERARSGTRSRVVLSEAAGSGG